MHTLLLYSAPENSQDAWMNFLPIGLGSLQAMLKSRGFSCRIANVSDMSRTQILAYIKAQKPDVIGVSMFTFNRGRSMELLEWAHQACPQAVLITGGPHPSHLASDVFAHCPHLNAIVKGEGEGALLELVKRLSQGQAFGDIPGLITRNGEVPGQGSVIENLDDIGMTVDFFETDFVDEKTQLAYVSTSRGCPGSCTFCNTPEFWGNHIRFRSAQSVALELEKLRHQHGILYFSFRDDTFTTRKSRTLELMDRIQKSGLYPVWNCQSRVNVIDEERLVAMKRAGCEFIQFGVEHGSERVLKLLDKGTKLDQVRQSLALVRKIGLNLGVYLITGIPEETWEDVQASGRIIKETRPHDVQISPLALYPGTRLFEGYRKQGLIRKDFFNKQGDVEVFARVDAHTRKALDHLSAVASSVQAKAAYTPAEIQTQKRFLGYCAVTNLIYGESLEQGGHFAEAETEYQEILRQEPDNPWGWLKRGQVRLTLGKKKGAQEDFKELLRLAPGNAQGLSLLQEIQS